MYDISKLTTFEYIDKIIHELNIEKRIVTTSHKYLIGTKLDICPEQSMNSKREVSYMLASLTAETNNMKFIELNLLKKESTTILNNLISAYLK